MRIQLNNKNYWILGMIGVIAILVLVVAIAGCTTQNTAIVSPSTAPSTTAPPTTKTVIDAAGRHVTIPYNVTRVLVLASAEDVNDEILLMGGGSTIINNLPTNQQQPFYHLQKVLIPQLASDPVLTPSEDVDPTAEQILAMHPDVCISDLLPIVQELQNDSIPAIYIGPAENVNQTEEAANVLGQVFNDPARAKAYDDFYNSILANISSRIASVPESGRPTVLYFYATRVWAMDASGWIVPAGGVEVFNPAGLTPVAAGDVAYPISMEQLLAWNPDIIVLAHATTDIPAMNNNSEFDELSAVQNHRVYVCPYGVCYWWRGAESPLMVEWAATKLYPNLFPQSELVSDMKTFYQEFYNYNVTDQDIANMLGGQMNQTTF